MLVALALATAARDREPDLHERPARRGPRSARWPRPAAGQEHDVGVHALTAASACGATVTSGARPPRRDFPCAASEWPGPCRAIRTPSRRCARAAPRPPPPWPGRPNAPPDASAGTDPARAARWRASHRRQASAAPARPRRSCAGLHVRRVRRQQEPRRPRPPDGMRARRRGAVDARAVDAAARRPRARRLRRRARRRQSPQRPARRQSRKASRSSRPSCVQHLHAVRPDPERGRGLARATRACSLGSRGRDRAELPSCRHRERGADRLRRPPRDDALAQLPGVPVGHHGLDRRERRAEQLRPVAVLRVRACSRIARSAGSSRAQVRARSWRSSRSATWLHARGAGQRRVQCVASGRSPSAAPGRPSRS